MIKFSKTNVTFFFDNEFRMAVKTFFSVFITLN